MALFRYHCLLHVLKYFSDSLQVRGTPASGKTTLAQLLAQHIEQQDPAVNVIGWPLEEVAKMGGWRRYLEKKGWIERERTVFIFDDAQLSYDDWDFWIGFLKSMHDFNDRRAIAFVSFGSPTSHIEIKGTTITMVASQRVTLRPIIHDDGLPSVGLFFSQEEFDDLVSKHFPPKQHFFDSSFFHAVFLVTGGHIGAIHDFIQIITDHDVGPHLRGQSSDLIPHPSHIGSSNIPLVNVTPGTHLWRWSVRASS
jgi:hypothetical protein